MRESKLAGSLLIAFGIVMLSASVLAAVLTKELIVDFASLILIGIGVRVRNGSRRAAGWGLFFMGLYVSFGIVMGFLVMAGRWDGIEINGTPIGEVDSVIPGIVAVLMLCWALMNFMKLRNARAATKSAPSAPAEQGT